MTDRQRSLLLVAMPWLAMAGLLLLWELACIVFDVPEILAPKPSRIFEVMVQRWDILLKFCLPRDFDPDGWSWLDEPAQWGWTQILTCAEEERPAMQTGGAAGGRDMRPLTGLKWSDATHRHLLHHTSQSTAKERYEWRSQEHTAARRDRNGAPYSMASTIQADANTGGGSCQDPPGSTRPRAAQEP